MNGASWFKFLRPCDVSGVGAAWHGHRSMAGAMNFANAIAFVGIGSAMWLLPLLAPSLFPHTAIDGSSTRALWTQFMGTLQCAIGVFVMARHLATNVMTQAERAAIPRGAVATADWQTDRWPDAAIAVDFVAHANHGAAMQGARTSGATAVTLEGEQAALWLSFRRLMDDEQALARLGRYAATLFPSDERRVTTTIRDGLRSRDRMGRLRAFLKRLDEEARVPAAVAPQRQAA